MTSCLAVCDGGGAGDPALHVPVNASLVLLRRQEGHTPNASAGQYVSLQVSTCTSFSYVSFPVRWCVINDVGIQRASNCVYKSARQLRHVSMPVTLLPAPQSGISTSAGLLVVRTFFRGHMRQCVSFVFWSAAHQCAKERQEEYIRDYSQLLCQRSDQKLPGSLFLHIKRISSIACFALVAQRVFLDSEKQAINKYYLPRETSW